MLGTERPSYRTARHQSAREANVDECTYERMDGVTDRGMDEKMDGQTNRQTNRLTDGQIVGRMDRHTLYRVAYSQIQNERERKTEFTMRTLVAE